MSKFLNLLKAMGFSTAADAAVQVGISTDTQPRLQIDAGGKHTWGAGGSSAGDTTLYRSAADTLKTDDSFIAAGGLTVKTIEIDTASASSNQVLQYNGTKFLPATISTGGATVSDTPPSSPSTGQMWFESDTGKTFVYYDSFWIEVGEGVPTMVIDDLSDVTITSATSGQALTYNGTAWVNSTVSTNPMNDSKFSALITMDIGA